MNKLDKVINQLKELSNGEVINVPLPDDNLLDDYEKILISAFQLNIESFSKKPAIFSTVQ